MDKGDCAADGRLIPQEDAALLCEGLEPGIIEGDWAFIRRDDVPAPLEGSPDMAKRRFSGLDVCRGHLDEDVVLCLFHDVHGRDIQVAAGLTPLLPVERR